MITLVYAQDLRGGIGVGNKLPWSLPNDLKHFKQTTMGHTILMGRKTFESMNCRLLPGRKSVVMTTQEGYKDDMEDLTVVNQLEDALALAKEEDLMVIGGSEIYNMFMPYADRIIRTLIEEKFDADTYIPEINRGEWKLLKKREGDIDEKNIYPHRFEEWVRKDKGEY